MKEKMLMLGVNILKRATMCHLKTLTMKWLPRKNKKRNLKGMMILLRARDKLPRG